MINPISSTGGEPAGDTRPITEPAVAQDSLHRPDGTLDAEAVYARLGELTRTLHNAMHALGYDRDIEQAAVSMLPVPANKAERLIAISGIPAGLYGAAARPPDADTLACMRR